MDWHLNLLFLLVLMPYAVYSWSPMPSTHSRSFYEYQMQPEQQRQRLQQQQQQQKQQQQRYYQPQRNSISPYLDLVLCPLREEPWTCARQRSARLLDSWDGELYMQWQKLKDEADRQLNATLERRGYSDTTTLSKEKPSTILKKIEIGTNYMKKYLSETMDGFLGREYEYLESNENSFDVQNVEENEAEEYEDEGGEEEDDEGEDDGENNNQTGDVKNTNHMEGNSNNVAHENNENDVEFVELAEGDNNDNDEESGDAIDELKKPGDGNKRRKKKKKGSQHEIATQGANLLIIQPLEQQLASQHHNAVGQQLLKPLPLNIQPSKQKKRKRKKGGHGGGTSTIVVEQEPASNNFGLGLLEELAELDDDVGGKRKRKHPMNYGRSNGVMRGKKKKKKKALKKLLLLGSFLKAKIELLLKMLGAHLQIKFFAVAFMSLMLNIARFWIDIKRGGQPQKVVYIEHAHHQHHYDEHGEDWNEPVGGYWKRSLQTDSTENTYDSVTDSYQLRQPHHMQIQQQYDPQYMVYRNHWQRK